MTQHILGGDVMQLPKSSMNNPVSPNFQAQQQQFCAWLRQPTQQAAPSDVALSRMQVYRELLFNNVCNFIDLAYPVAQTLLPKTLWQQLQQQFFANYRCESPFYLDISLHFREYLFSHDAAELAAYPWLNELLHYEWLELYVDTAPNMPPSMPLLGVTSRVQWQLQHTVWVLVYHYRVYQWRIDSDINLAQLQAAPSAILVWRDATYQMQQRVLSPIAAICMDALQQQQAALSKVLSIGTSSSGALTTAALLSLCQQQCANIDAVLLQDAILQLHHQLTEWQLLPHT